MFMSFGSKAVEGGRESTHKKPGQSLGRENEDPNLGTVGDTSFLWSAGVRGQCACNKVFVLCVHSRVKGTCIPNEFGGLHVRSLARLLK